MQRIGPYALGPVIGEGAMSVVHRATGPQGEVALKLARAAVADDAAQRRRFQREARALVGVADAHVVPVLDAGEQDGRLYLVQPLLRGGTLKELLQEHGPLDLRAVVRVCTHVARGLGALHKRGMVHRDVKPANILLDGDGRAHVADFGLVKRRDASLLTRPGQPVGTQDYMAPEQVRGDEVGPRADVYALGCVTFECVCGAPPFAGRPAFDVLFAHIGEAPPDPCADRPDVPPEVGAVIAHALAKVPAERPPTALAFAHLLRAGAAARA